LARSGFALNAGKFRRLPMFNAFTQILLWLGLFFMPLFLRTWLYENRRTAVSWERINEIRKGLERIK
jgi:hypothetical protein